MGDRKLLFDVSRPFVVRSAMTYRGAACMPGDRFDGAGISEGDLVLLYQAGKIRNADPAPPVDAVVTFAATPGERVDVPPPAPDARPAKRARAGA